MEQRPRGRPPKVEKINTSRNAVIKITLSMPNHSDYEDEIVIKDILGKVIGSKKRPEVFMQTIKDKLNDIS